MMRVQGLLKNFALCSLAVLPLWGCDTLSGDCYDGQRTYEDGAQWTCLDGCNSCGCHNGTVSQTAIGCAQPPGPAAGKLKCFDGQSWRPHADAWQTSAGCDARCNDGRVTTDCS